MTVADTSRVAYHATQPLQKTQKERILDALREVEDATDKELATVTGIGQHLVPARRGELLAEGKIEEYGTRFCRVSGHRAKAWRLASNQLTIWGTS